MTFIDSGVQKVVYINPKGVIRDEKQLFNIENKN